MSDTDVTFDEEDLPPETADEPPAIKQMRAAIRRQKAELTELRQGAEASLALARENAFLKAGVDLQSPVGKLFARAYDGELDPAVIVAAAKDVGALLGNAAAMADPELSAEEAAQTAERANLAADAGAAGTLPTENPLEAGYREFQAGLKAGKPRNTAAAAVLSRMIAGANEGDPQFRYDPNTWLAQQEEAMR